METAMAGLKLDRLFVVYPGSRSWVRSDRVEWVSIRDLPGRVRAFGG